MSATAPPVLAHSAGISHLRVYGDPAPKGSKRIGLVAGRHIPVDDAKGYAAWNAALRDAANEWRLRRLPMLDGPLVVEAAFYLRRPGRTKFEAVPAGKPDLDKLLRSTGDPFSGTVWADDARIVSFLRVGKVWADETNAPGVLVRVWRHSL
jgi:Holliday junction resolvase RusA-like endonuclease